jgi:DNA-binding Lrp family transcriptional regulator
LPADRADFVALLEKRGPSITAIAREMHLSPETARYWYKQCILNRRGFALQAFIDEQEFGLRRVYVFADFDDRFLPYARDIFAVLSTYLGLTYYIRTLPSGTFINSYQIPKERLAELVKALDDLKSLGVFKKFEVMPVNWRRFVPMKAKYYNFTKGVWEFDWASATEGTSDELPPLAPSKPVKFDYNDLQMITELQANSTRSVRKIAKVLKMDYDVAYRHYTHIMKQGMIAGYKVRWVETSVKKAEGRANWRDVLFYNSQHKYQSMLVLLRNLKQAEQTLVMRKVSAIPFLFNLNGGDGSLYFEMQIPFSYQSEVLHFLHDTVSPYRDSLTFLFTDQSFAMGSSIPSESFDRETNKWTYRSEECVAAFKSLLPKIEGAASSRLS